ALASTGYWLDVGTPDRYLQATADLLTGARPGPPAPGARPAAGGSWALGNVRDGGRTAASVLSGGAGGLSRAGGRLPGRGARCGGVRGRHRRAVRAVRGRVRRKGRRGARQHRGAARRRGRRRGPEGADRCRRGYVGRRGLVPRGSAVARVVSTRCTRSSP